MLLVMVIDGVSTKLMDKDDPESHVKKNERRIYRGSFWKLKDKSQLL